MVRGKFRVQSVTDFGSIKQVKLAAVCNDGTPENERFHKYTPSGEITISIDNPPASDVFSPGLEFYVDFTQIKQDAAG